MIMSLSAFDFVTIECGQRLGRKKISFLVGGWSCHDCSETVGFEKGGGPGREEGSSFSWLFRVSKIYAVEVGRVCSDRRDEEGLVVVGMDCVEELDMVASKKGQE